MSPVTLSDQAVAKLLRLLLEHNGPRVGDCNCKGDCRANDKRDGTVHSFHFDGSPPRSDRGAGFDKDLSGPFWPANDVVDGAGVVDLDVHDSSPSGVGSTAVTVDASTDTVGDAADDSDTPSGGSSAAPSLLSNLAKIRGHIDGTRGGAS